MASPHSHVPAGRSVPAGPAAGLGGKRCPGSPARRCTGWCVRCCPGSGSGPINCCCGWRIRSYATNGRAAPTRDAAPPAVNAEWTLHPEPVVVVLGDTLQEQAHSGAQPRSPQLEMRTLPGLSRLDGAISWLHGELGTSTGEKRTSGGQCGEPVWKWEEILHSSSHNFPNCPIFGFIRSWEFLKQEYFFISVPFRPIRPFRPVCDWPDGHDAVEDPQENCG